MKEQWPSERYNEKVEAFTELPFKDMQDFLDLLSAFPSGFPHQDFNEVVTWIIDQEVEIDDLKKRITTITDTANLDNYPDSQNLVMTFACAAALARAPSLQVWGKVKTFTYNSWHIEHWLVAAMLAYVEVNPKIPNLYVELAKEVLVGLEIFSIKSKSDSINNERRNTWTHWNECQSKLDEIWWGLRGQHGFMNYQDELPLFKVFYKLEPDDYFRTVSRLKNPYLISALLFVAGIGSFNPRFSEWKRMVTIAPVAFEDNGKWNGSVLIPLLLLEARNQLMQVPSNLQNLSTPTPDERDTIKREITSTAELIVANISKRKDVSAIFARWSPWLIRQILTMPEKEIDDVTSSAFSNDALLEAIGSNLAKCALPLKSPDDASSWEAWCYRCALASFSYNGHIQVPDWESFGDEWRLSPDDWVDHKGHQLRKHSSLITTLNNGFPGIAANLLAYPIAQASESAEAWITLWNDAIVLREIVEFGDADAIEDEYRSRSEAGRLLLLLFRIGLAIFDQGATQCSDNNSPEARSLAKLFKAMHLATNEMLEIDITLNRDEWLSAIHHLAVRRMIWQQSSGHETATINFQVFQANDFPGVSDILSEAKNNVVELVPILQSLMLNTRDTSKLKAACSNASINLVDIVQPMKRLNRYHSRKYPIDNEQLRKLEIFAKNF